jgi:hypothetical protein
MTDSERKALLASVAADLKRLRADAEKANAGFLAYLIATAAQEAERNSSAA